MASKVTLSKIVSEMWDLFEKQSQAYKDEVLPPACTARLAIEAGATMGWEKYVGQKGRVLGVDRYGASAPYKTIAEKFGFTPANDGKK